MPPCEPGLRPAALANRAFRVEVAAAGVPLVIRLERSDGESSRFETQVYPQGHPRFTANLFYVERLVRFLLWGRGGYKVYLGGPAVIAAHIAACFAPGGRQPLLNNCRGDLWKADLIRRPQS